MVKLNVMIQQNFVGLAKVINLHPNVVNKSRVELGGDRTTQVFFEIIWTIQGSDLGITD